MISDVIKIHKSRIEYIKKSHKGISSFLGVSKARIILYEENMIIKYIPKKEKKHADKLIEEFIKDNFYNQKNLLFHYKEFKCFIVLYCIISNAAIDKVSKEYKSISIIPVQHIIVAFVLRRTKSADVKFIFYRSNSSIMFLSLQQRVLLHTALLKETTRLEVKAQIFDILKELTELMSLKFNEATVIFINCCEETQKVCLEAFSLVNHKVLEIFIEEGELISANGKKCI